MMLFCFALVNKFTCRVQGWLEHQRTRHSLKTPNDTHLKNILSDAVTDGLPSPRQRRLHRPIRCPIRRSLKGSDDQPNAVLHHAVLPHPTEPR